MYGRFSVQFWRILRILLVVVLAVVGTTSALAAAPASKMAPGDRERAAQAVVYVGAAITGGGAVTTPPAGGTEVLDPDELVTHTASGISLVAPARWEIKPDRDNIFTLGLPGEFVFGFLSQESADEFPGIFAIVFFEQQSDLLAASMGEDVTLQDLARFETDQGLPGLIVRFGGDMSGLDMTGSMYIVAAGDVTYMLMVLADDEGWAAVQADADVMAASLTVENPSPLVTGGTDGLAYTTADGAATVDLPADWQIQELENEDIPVMLVNPGMTFVAVGLWEPIDTLVDATDLALYNALLSAVAGSDTEAEVLDLLIQSMDMGSEGDDIVIDQAATALFDSTDPPVLRLGATVINEEMTMPMMAYVQAREDGLVGLMAFGNMDDVLDAEETILEILASVVLGK